MHYKIGTALDRGGLAGAEHEFTRVLALAEELAAQKADDLDLSRMQWITLTGYSDHLETAGNLTGALRYLDRGHSLLVPLARLDPSNVQLQRDLVVSFANRARILIALARNKEAVHLARQGLTIAAGLAASDPQNVRAKHFLAHVRVDLGDGLVADGQLAAAVEVFHEAIAVAEEIGRDLDNAEFRMELVRAYGGLGAAHAARARTLRQPDPREEAWQDAGAWRTKSQDVWLDPNKRGMAPGSQSKRIEKLDRDMAECHTAPAKLALVKR